MALLVLLATGLANAQNVSGDLKGKLEASGGVPIEGANVRVSGPAMQSERGVTTLADGTFVLFGLPVGEHTVTITHISYREEVIYPVRIRLGSLTNLGRIELQPGETTLDTLVVAASKVPYRSEFATQLSKGVMDNIPVDRDYRSAITILPQVNASYFGDGLSINGSTGAENMFFLNGINITDNFASAWAPNLNSSSLIPYNFIREVNVKQSGYSAEYGRAIGGVLDVVTHSGTNEFKGQAFSYYSGSFLNADPKEGLTGATVGKTSNYDLGLSLGGPLVKNKLWYFAAYSFYQNTLDTKVAGSFYPDKTTAHMATLKIDWAASPKTKLDLMLLADPTERTPIVSIDGTFGTNVPAIVENVDAMWAKIQSGGINAAISGTTQIASNSILEYGWSGYKRKATYDGVTEYGDTTRQYYDYATATISGGVGYNEDYNLGKNNVRVKMTYADQVHTVKGGVELEFNTMEGPARTPAGGNIFKEDLTYDFYTTIDYRNYSSTASWYQAAFLQHDWQVSERVLLEIGIRWERQQLRTFDGRVMQTFDNQWQPRFGLNWLLDESGNKKVSFNYGRVYQAIPLNFGFLLSTGVSEFSVNAYSSDPRVAGTPKDSIIFSGGGSNQVSNTKNQFFQTMVSDQLSLQYSQSITNKVLFTAKLLYKTSTDPFIISRDSLLTPYIGNPGRGDLSFLSLAEHDYTAAEIGLSGTLLDDRFAFNVFYIWSRNYGNFMGSWDQEVRFYSLGASTFAQTTPERQARQTGLLPSDRTHSLKLNASYRLRFGLSVGTNLTVMRGTPLNEFIRGVYDPQFFDLLTQRGSAGRLPILWDLSFRFSYKNPKLPIRLSMDVFHVGNPQAVVDQVQLKYTDQAGTSLNPAFGQPVHRQPPMAVRFGIEYNF
jgi:hypothetical protein